ncbi:hypothetical protein Patl1_00912 [Pistacia atlantica]|uniref:Uncharacterized protein n=1 Tax=Pistacia atlantica TaxID=434234 RepID=A0ACC1C832_9ROSI|nr:hypothetical protein Patl1_00912 [Pistacia atlantica]
MGSESNSTTTSTSVSTSSPSSSGKRSRDPEDEVYLDNLHSHKRYLSEIMASSLNGLTVGDSLSENLMESPARYQRPLSGFCSAPSTSSYPSHSCTVSGSQPRQRGSDSEGRFPSSPSDICHSADLRRAALLRSVQMRTQPPGMPSFEQEPVEERPCSYIKSLVDEREYQIEECSSLHMSEPEFSQEKSCRVLNMNMKGDESRG